MPRTTRSKASTAESQDAKSSSSSTTSSSSSSKTKSKSTTSSKSSIYTLAPEVESPPRIFILPKSATPQSRIVTLQNPRYAKPTRYLVCPDSGSFYEFTKIAAPQQKSPRSWLIDSAKLPDGTTAITPAQTTKDSELYVATQIDPLFLVLPALAAADKKQQRMFLSSDDHFDAVSEQDSDGKRQNHLLEVLKWPQARNLLEKRMAAVCDTVEAGDETMFRLNESKLVEELLSKAKRMSEGGLPKSMEEKFVAKALEAPIVGIRTTVLSRSDTTVSTESQEETTTTSSLSEATTAVATPTSTSGAGTGAGAEVIPSLVPTPEILNLQRLRVSLNFLTSSYLPPSLSSHLKSSLSSPSSVDFSPLDSYLAQLAKLRQEAVASRSHSDFSRKRIAGDEEEAFERAEKRRKKEEEEKAKKAGVSRGVKELAKVNTRGMMKLTSFFQKKT
ncbi:ribonuclease H2, subunit B [Neurospora crassa]|nr:ribonuclease H2, subunit B [Neurospora crassa]